MKILITGGAGYIGSILTEKLLSSNFEITVVDNFSFSQNSLAHLAYNKKLKIINSDIRRFDNYNKIISSSDYIIPLAALVGAPVCNYDPVNAKSINFDAQVSLFKMLSKSQRVLMPTTNSAYGSGLKDNFCDENSPLKPLSNYAIEKVNLERELLDRENVVSFRLATVFGASPRMRTDLLVNDFVYKAIKDKYIVLFEENFKRNFIHVRDVANVFKYSINNFKQFKNNIFNVGLSSANISKLELCELIKKYIPNFSIKVDTISNDPDKRNYIVSNKKLEKTGFKTLYSLDDGILELNKLYKSIKDYRYRNI